MSLHFEKVQGLGNDFVLIDARLSALMLSAAGARRLCDRRLGIGADGVLTLLPPSEASAAARLHIYNADGSEAEMCGNGLRCAARYLLEWSEPPSRGVAPSPGLSPAGGEGLFSVDIETAAGLRECRLEGSEVRAEVGKATVAEPETLTVEGERLRGSAVSIGNPHFVIFDRADDGRARRLGPLLERHARFAPARTNVELCETTPDGLRVAVWERGSGLTLACGTGAAAAAAVAVRERLFASGRALAVDLPGGRLHVEVADDLSIWMRGPARRVYRGEIELEAGDRRGAA
ncbi:MAG: diaminopimelate epimerase [Myxococcales bacterium]